MAAHDKRLPKPTDDDYQAALHRWMLSPSWAQVKAQAQQEACKRALDANGARTKALCDRLRACPDRAEYRAVQDELTKLFAEHEVLLDGAYPESAAICAHARAAAEQGEGSRG